MINISSLLVDLVYTVQSLNEQVYAIFLDLSTRCHDMTAINHVFFCGCKKIIINSDNFKG